MATVYPISIDTDDTLYIAVNGVRGKLANDHDSNITTITVDSTAGAAASGYATIVGEAIHYTAKTATTLTGVTRHTDGTQAASHKQGDVVKFGLVAAHHNSLKDAVIAVETKLGTGTTISGAQLTNASILGPKLYSGNHKARATANAATVVNATTFTKVLMAVEKYDLGNEYNTATSRFTASVAGYVSVKAAVAWAVPSSTRRRIVLIYKNGAEYARVADAVYSGQPGSNYVIQPISSDVDMAVNDYIELYCYSTAADSTNYLGGDADASWITFSMNP